MDGSLVLPEQLQTPPPAPQPTSKTKGSQNAAAPGKLAGNGQSPTPQGQLVLPNAPATPETPTEATPGLTQHAQDVINANPELKAKVAAMAPRPDQGVLSTWWNDLKSYAKPWIRMVQTGGKEMPPLPPEGDVGDEFKRARGAGHGRLYSAAAEVNKGLLGIDPAPMEQASLAGHPGEVIGHAAAPATLAAAPLITEGALRATKAAAPLVAEGAARGLDAAGNGIEGVQGALDTRRQRMGGELFEKAAGTPSEASGFHEAISNPAVKEHLAEIDRQGPLKTKGGEKFREAAQRIRDYRDTIWERDHTQPIKERADLPTEQANYTQKAQDYLDGPDGEAVKRRDPAEFQHAQEYLDRMKQDKLNVKQLDAARKDLVQATRGRYGEAQPAKTTVQKIVLGDARNELDRVLGENGYPDIRARNRAWGQLGNIADVLERRAPTAERIADRSLMDKGGSSVMKGSIAGAGAALAGETSVGRLISGVVSMGDFFRKLRNEPARQLSRGFSKLGASRLQAPGPPAEFIPPVPRVETNPARLLAAPPLVTPPPADTSFVRSVPAELATREARPMAPPSGAGRIETTGLRSAPDQGIMLPGEPHRGPGSNLLPAPREEAPPPNEPTGGKAPAKPVAKPKAEPMTKASKLTVASINNMKDEARLRAIVDDNSQPDKIRKAAYDNWRSVHFRELPRGVKETTAEGKPIPKTPAGEKQAKIEGASAQNNPDWVTESRIAEIRRLKDVVSSDKSTAEERQIAASQLQEHESALQAKPMSKPGPVASRYPPEVLNQALAEMRGSVELSDALGRPGRYQIDLSTPGDMVGPSAKEQDAAWYGIKAQKHNIAGQYPWFEGSDISASKVQKALEKGSGADYERIVGRIADGMMAERETARPVIEEYAPRLRTAAEQVKTIDPGLSATLTDLAEGRSNGFTDLKQYIEEKLEDASQAAQFNSAFDAAVREARGEAGIAETPGLGVEPRQEEDRNTAHVEGLTPDELTDYLHKRDWSLPEGEEILRSGNKPSGAKASPEYLANVRRQVDKDRARVAELEAKRKK